MTLVLTATSHTSPNPFAFCVELLLHHPMSHCFFCCPGPSSHLPVLGSQCGMHSDFADTHIRRGRFAQNVSKLQIQWHIPVAPVLERLRLEDHRFKVSVGFIVNSGLKNQSKITLFKALCFQWPLRPYSVWLLVCLFGYLPPGQLTIPQTRQVSRTFVSPNLQVSLPRTFPH